MSEYQRQSKTEAGKSSTHEIVLDSRKAETLNFYAGVTKESGTLVGTIEIHTQTVGSGGFAPLLDGDGIPVAIDAATLTQGVPIKFPGNDYIDQVQFKFVGFSGGTVRTFVFYY